MKKSGFVLCVASILLFSCVETFSPKLEIDAESEKSRYGEKILIEPMNETVKISKKMITITPAEENAVYTISGYFDGQIVTQTKNTVLKLDNAYLENSSGKSAVRLGEKTEISGAKDSTNYIVSRGRSFAKSGAIQSKKDLVLGGSGTLYIKGQICHAVEAEDVKIKGSGNFYLEGTKKGSCVTCETFAVESDKTFAAYFLNSKNGIKADKTIRIESGTFHLYDNDTAFKTETGGNSPRQHSVTLSGGKFFLHENKNLVATEKGAFDERGAEIRNAN